MGARLLGGLPGFLRESPLNEASRRAIEHSLRDRSSSFVELVRRAVFEFPESPYLPLLGAAGISFGRFRELVAENEVEGALEYLYEAGVWVSLDEFKGRTPIRRGELVVPTVGGAFDNPVSARHFEARSGGSRSPGSRFIVDLALLAHEALYDRLFLDMFGLAGRPCALWHPGPPGSAGLKWALRLSRLGQPIERWFSQTEIGHDPRSVFLVRGISLVSRLVGRPVPTPEHVGVSEGIRVARWLSDQRARGTPAWLSTTASCAVRVCQAARLHDLDISGTFFRTSGEPLSAGKAAVMAASGVVARCHFAMAEVGRIGMACERPRNGDDVHLVSDKVALLQHEVVRSGGVRVGGLFLSTLKWSAPKVMLNVELGDSAVVGPAACGCLWPSLGFVTTLHNLRSYEKLTSEGMHFVGAELIAIVDEMLPARFGGGPTDYQFVEEERDGVTTVSLVMSPRIEAADPDAVISAVLEALASRDGAARMMSAVWRDSSTLRLVRREPSATNAGKVLTLHVERGKN